MICGGCIPWNAPLAIQAPLAAEGHAVPLRFEQWLLYHLHVVQHQTHRWAGEIDALANLVANSQESVL